VALLVAFGACGHASAGNVSGLTTNGIELRLAAGRSAYRPGEPITFTVRVRNETDHPVELDFPTAQRFDVTLKNSAGREVWRWSSERMFAQQIGRETLPPRGERTFTATVDEPLAPGQYTAAAELAAANSRVRTNVSVTIH
jgi:hypothetical protein